MVTAAMLEPKTQPSQLLATLIEQVEQTRPLQILDAGFGVPETLGFFGQFRCQLYFSAFYDLLQMAHESADPESEEVWFRVFQQRMNYPEGTCFDLCLFWDLLSYLNDVAVRAFNRALAPYIDQHTSGHSFALLNTAPYMPAKEYGVATRTQVIARPLDSPRSTPYPRSRSRVAEQFSGFAIGRSVLHQSGLMEFTLKGKVSS
jgi:hypothetical protein